MITLEQASIEVRLLLSKALGEERIVAFSCFGEFIPSLESIKKWILSERGVYINIVPSDNHRWEALIMDVHIPATIRTLTNFRSYDEALEESIIYLLDTYNKLKQREI